MWFPHGLYVMNESTICEIGKFSTVIEIQNDQRNKLLGTSESFNIRE